MENKVLEAITNRCSTRAYTNEEITKEELELIIDAGLKAPTGMNLRELTFSVIKGDNPVLEELDKVKRALRNQDANGAMFFYGASYLILISADESNKWAHVDAGIAVENMAIAAEGLGLGSLIIGCIYDAFHSDKKEYFNEKAGIPEGKNFVIALAVGHKAEFRTAHTFVKDEQVVYIK